jgi:hypothetical protein
MIGLKNSYKDKEAVVIFGGTSIITNGYDLSLLSKKNSILFLESKALTPYFKSFNIEPDYFFMPYPEKTRTNSLQHVFIQSISSGFNLENSLKKKYVQSWLSFKDNFGKNADIWRIDYPHKKYRIKSNIVLNDSPISLIQDFPNMKLITNDEAYKKDGFSSMNFPNEVLKYSHTSESTESIDKYFEPKNINGKLVIESMGFVNSAATSMYPILKYMGFKRVVLIGMDMSNLGSMEFSAPYSFKSIKHYGKFYNKSRHTFSHSFPLGFKNGMVRFCISFCRDLIQKNTKDFFSLKKYKILHRNIFGLQGRYLRPKDEMQNCNELFIYKDLDFVNVYESFKFAKPIPAIKNVSYKDFINNKY